MTKQLTKMTKSERLHASFALDAMEMIQFDIHDFLFKQKGMPHDWNNIACDRDKRDAKRTRITASFDADMVKFFKALGPGYQHRMNRVLRAFMHASLAGLVDGADGNRFITHPEDVEDRARYRIRAEWGDEILRELEDQAQAEGRAAG